jgi:5-methylcytosine-specific restriction endonuclease McrA
MRKEIKRRTLRSHCKRGHEYTLENTRINTSGGRICRACASIYRDNRLYEGNREVAIQRDGEKCVKCGMTRDEHKKRYKFDITVDHKDGKGTHVPAKERNNAIDNLQTLCIHCHVRKDSKFQKITDIQAINIRHVYGGEWTRHRLARLYGVSDSLISDIVRNKWHRREDIELRGITR